MTRSVDSAGRRSGHPVGTLVTATSTAFDLVTEFRWSRDRIAHRLRLRPANPGPAGVERELGWSAEGDASDDWPPSPPFQQLDECLLAADRQGLVAIGMAGTSHWSLAVEVEDEMLWFDVACRVQQPGPGLSSTYEFADSFQLRADGNQTCLMLESSQIPWPAVRVAVDESLTELVATGGQRRVVFRPNRSATRFPCTIRWRYGFGLAARTA